MGVLDDAAQKQDWRDLGIAGLTNPSMATIPP
jgi:hypothetical protein